MLRQSVALVALAAALVTACDRGGADGALQESDIVPFAPFAMSSGVPGGEAALEAAAAFRATLSRAQVARLMLPIDSPARRNWSNLPAGAVDFEHAGVRIGDMEPDQLAAFLGFLAAGLGRHGYETVAQIVAAESVLASESSVARWLDGVSAGNYWVAFFGDPTPEGAWGWQFGGHHLAVNASMDGGRVVSLSPTFLGIEPGSYELHGVHHAPFADHLADGRALIAALPEALREEALVERPRDIHAGPGDDGVLPPVEGVLAADWPDDARDMLLDLIAHWLRVQPAENAQRRLAEVESALDETGFAWQADADDVYYRIQGPTLIIELSLRGGAAPQDDHFHSVYRDPTNEYGGAL